MLNAIRYTLYPILELPIILKLLIAAALGAFIGIERETAPREAGSEESKYEFVAGIRSHALIGLLGAVLGVVLTAGFYAIVYLIATAFLMLLVLSYSFMAFRVKAPGITSELAALFTFLTGFLISLEILPLHIIITLTIILSFVLSRKESIHNWMRSIQRKEIYAVVSFAIISLAILPFLPNKEYSFAEIGFLRGIFSVYNIKMGAWSDIDIVNPFTLWLVVVLICGVSLVGHMLSKFFQKKNTWLLVSIVGGLVSSTATSIALSRKSRGASFSLNKALAAAAVSATLASFITMLILIAPLSREFLLKATIILLPMFLAGFISVLAILFFYKDGKELGEIMEIDGSLAKSEKIFSLEDALKFAALLFSVKILTRFALFFFGGSAFFASSMLASFAGVDPVIVNLAEMASGLIGLKIALIAFLAVNGMNFFAKIIYAFWFGDKKFALKILLVFIFMFAAGLLGLWYLV